MAQEFIVDLSEIREKNLLLSKLRDLTGKWRVSLVRHRKRRTDRQNRYYWPCFVQPFAEALREQGVLIDGHEASENDAHELFKYRFLTRTAIDPATGETMGDIMLSTSILNTLEFNEYLDKCAQLLAERYGIVVPEPSVYHEHEESPDEAYEVYEQF